MINKKLQVFISSTYEDLKVERQAAVETVLKAGHIPAGMELFTSNSETQLDTIKRWIDNSDIFLLILGPRYGSLEPNTGLSYTQLEYQYAKKTKKPIVSVVMNEKAMKERRKEIDLDDNERINGAKYIEFHKIVLANTTEFFDGIHQMRSQISDSIRDKVDRFGSELSGWVSGKDVAVLEAEKESIKSEMEKYKDIIKRLEVADHTSLNRNTYLIENKSILKEKAVKSGNLGDTISEKNIDVNVSTIQDTETGFRIYFSVLNKSDIILRDNGRFKFKVSPELYQDEINGMGYSIKTTNDKPSGYIYPNQKFEGYYEWNTKLEFNLTEITYQTTLNGINIPIATWLPLGYVK